VVAKEVKLSDIGGAHETAEELGVDTRLLWLMAKRQWDFPKPIHRLAATPLYDLNEIRAWGKKYNARKGKNRGAPKGNTNAKVSNERRHQDALLRKRRGPL
jgi:hypothetical protein